MKKAVRFSDAERELITKALVGLALDGDRAADRHEIHGFCDGADCSCESAICTAAEVAGEVVAISGGARAIVDSVLNNAELLKESERAAILDARGIPTAGCPNCGEQWINVPMIFDDETYDVAAWGLEGTCFSCGTKVTVCTPVDKDAEGTDE